MIDIEVAYEDLNSEIREVADWIAELQCEIIELKRRIHTLEQERYRGE